MKHHTVILIPHGRARVRQWMLSDRQVLLTALGAAAILLVALFSLAAFLTKAVDRHELVKLSEENRELRQTNQEFETSLRELKADLIQIEQRTHELAIVAGVDGLDISQQSGVGGAEVEARYQTVEDQLDRIAGRLDERGRLIAATPSISPVRGILTSAFGLRTDPITGKPSRHRAVDLSTAPGRPVVATADGIVLQAERDGRLGNSIVVAHGFGFTTRYAHLSRFDVAPGQRVARGQVIGYVGNTGRTTGYHLHYEVRLDGRPVDPRGFMLDFERRGLS